MLLSRFLVKKLIELVKRNPVLYDFNHASRKNSDAKELVWREISLKLDVEENILRAKWKNLRDCYRKHLRANAAEETNRKVKSYMHWQWADQLEFLQPYTDSTAANGNETLYDDEQQNSEDDNLEDNNYDSENDECYDEDDESPKERKRRKIGPESKPVQGLDAIEHIFLGYAKTIKKLPVKSQISVRMKIAKLIMEEELKCLK